ncbi:GtrA family protein [Rarobacter faecitabidus]|uniref:Putative flippase GtrA n=1 Tax=Rarobacter faecitabidus TaxID=13243 RepID=A0A542ZU27_RARFA|nr:GtrA family protein [Rarobacter faecitabidus]TQL63868.1 putative flippase GtrA [Rarobacter faecitabidus]
MHRRTSLLNHPWATRILEILRFSVVGGAAYIVDVGLFNLLRFGPGDLLADKPLTAKIISASVATVVAWIGNRYWTFARSRTDSSVRELVSYAIVNVAGMGIAVGCLWLSHYVLGFTSAVADNIAANVVGLLLGTLFRYFAYRTWVFTGAGRVLTDESSVNPAQVSSAREASEPAMTRP